jgi:hypothetical protein
MALFLLLAPTALASTTWYVNGVSANDANTCTSPTSACKTIRHAISLASSGDYIMVGAATYEARLLLIETSDFVNSPQGGQALNVEPHARQLCQEHPRCCGWKTSSPSGTENARPHCQQTKSHRSEPRSPAVRYEITREPQSSFRHSAQAAVCSSSSATVYATGSSWCCRERHRLCGASCQSPL